MAATVASYAQLLAADGLDRIRVCTNPDCSWLFYDQTRNRSRRWCDPRICGTLRRVRRHRTSLGTAPKRPTACACAPAGSPALRSVATGSAQTSCESGGVARAPSSPTRPPTPCATPRRPQAFASASISRHPPRPRPTVDGTNRRRNDPHRSSRPRWCCDDARSTGAAWPACCGRTRS